MGATRCTIIGCCQVVPAERRLGTVNRYGIAAIAQARKQVISAAICNHCGAINPWCTNTILEFNGNATDTRFTAVLNTITVDIVEYRVTNTARDVVTKARGGCIVQISTQSRDSILPRRRLGGGTIIVVQHPARIRHFNRIIARGHTTEGKVAIGICHYGGNHIQAGIQQINADTRQTTFACIRPISIDIKPDAICNAVGRCCILVTKISRGQDITTRDI